MATIIIHAGHFKPGKINIRLGIPANSIFYTPDVMRLTDVGAGSVIYYKLEDLAGLEVASEESTKKMMGAIGWGLVGDLALGPLGLLAGVLSGGKQTNVKFIGNFKDGRRMLATTDSKTFTAMQAALFNKTLAPISPPEPAAQPTQVDKPAAQPTQVVWRSPRTKIGDATKRQTFLLFGGLIALVTVFSLIGGGTKPAVQPTQVVQAAAPIVVSDGCDFAGAIPNCKAIVADLVAKGVKGNSEHMEAAKPAEHAHGRFKEYPDDDYSYEARASRIFGAGEDAARAEWIRKKNAGLNDFYKRCPMAEIQDWRGWCLNNGPPF
jgi:hypothetical protein